MRTSRLSVFWPFSALDDLEIASDGRALGAGGGR